MGTYFKLVTSSHSLNGVCHQIVHYPVDVVGVSLKHACVLRDSDNNLDVGRDAVLFEYVFEHLVEVAFFNLWVNGLARGNLFELANYFF